jgi:Putative prokaryotic signal transducing protein
VAGSYDDWEKVAEVRERYQADLIALRLQEAGLEAQVLDQSFEQIPLPMVPNFEVVRVLVPVAQLEEARRVLSQESIVPDADMESEAPVEDEE